MNQVSELFGTMAYYVTLHDKKTNVLINLHCEATLIYTELEMMIF